MGQFQSHLLFQLPSVLYDHEFYKAVIRTEFCAATLCYIYAFDDPPDQYRTVIELY